VRLSPGVAVEAQWALGAGVVHGLHVGLEAPVEVLDELPLPEELGHVLPELLE
jgi:hypothetical protein